MKPKILYQSERYRVETDGEGVVVRFSVGNTYYLNTAIDLAKIEAAHHAAENPDEDAAYYAAYRWLKAHLNTLPSVQNVTPTAWSIVTQKGDGSHYVTRDEQGGYWLHGVRYGTLSAAVASVMGVEA